jgi:hypothetical protein
MRPWPPPILRALALRISTNALAAREGSELELRAFALLGQVIVAQGALSRRIFGRARLPAMPLKVGPDQAGADTREQAELARRGARSATPGWPS